MCEQLQNSLVRYGKIYQDIGFIFLLGKFLDDGGLSYPACSFYKKRGLSVLPVFPFEHLLVNLASEYFIRHDCNSVFLCKFIRFVGNGKMF